ncbi:MAG: uracil-DNA glycosylase family protein [Candidatus Thorarchaeota archaeon]
MAKPTDSWKTLRQEILECHKCPLANSRTQAVPGVGPDNATLVIIGEAPGRQEDLQGEPFVGAAGRLLTKLLEQAGIKRESVFITNVVKCRPPENRQPTQSEREACHSFLIRQLEHIKPLVVALVGRVPAETLLKMAIKMGELHGKPVPFGGRTYFVMYHPAAGLYNQNLLPEMEKDMQELKRLLSGDSSSVEAVEKGQLGLSRFFTKEKK